MSDLKTHDNIRVRLYALCTGATVLDYRFNQWVCERKKDACAFEHSGVIKYTGDPEPKIVDHEAFDDFLKTYAARQGHEVSDDA